MTTRDSHIAILVVLIVMLAGCGQKTASTEPPPAASAPASPTDQPAAQEPRPPAESPGAPAPRAVSGSASAQAAPSATAPQSAEDFTDEPALKDVLFDPGHADVGRIGARTLKDNARWMVENAGYLVLVEGHTDYKGSREANLAMGERRAKAAVSVLLKDGVPDSRLFTVSYGSDRPVCSEKTEACAAKNRRVHFRVKKKQ
jgi:peptidoglycan-associated lipoprotein